MGTRASALLTLLFLAASAVNLAGQGFTGGLRGTVMDASGVVPAAEVTLTNEATSATRSITTNAQGVYAFEIISP